MRLYHLTKANYALSNIKSQRLKIARFGDLNDPFELLAAELSDKEFRKAIRSWKNDFHKTIGLLCFSEHWGNPVLWSHYADKHRGICLGFDVFEEFALQVNYTEKRMPVEFQDNDPDRGLSFEFVNKLLKTKYIHWKYEEERRVYVELDESTKDNGQFFYPFDDKIQLKEVIIGPSCEISVNEIESMKIIKDKSIRVIKARLGFNNFEVVIDQRYE